MTARLFNVKTSKAIQVIIDSISSPRGILHYEFDLANDRVLIKAVDGRLFITQTRENHRQIVNLMAPASRHGAAYRPVVILR